MKRLYCSTSRLSYVTAKKSLRTDSPQLSHSSQWNGGHETSFPPPTLPLALMARPFAASQPHCYAQDPNFCPKRDLTPTHVSGPFVAFHLAPTLDRREEARAPVHGTHCVPPPPLPARDRFCFDAPCLGLSSLFLVLDFSLEESSIRRSTESPLH